MQFPVDMVPFDKWVAFRGDFPCGAGNHRMIILQRTENNIEYFYVTSYESEEEKNKINLNNRKDINSIAELQISDWDILTKNSCVQCNLAHIHEISVKQLKDRYQRREIEYLGYVPEIVKRKIIDATCSSVSFTDTKKKIYTT